MKINPSKLNDNDFSGNWQDDMPDVFRLINKLNSDTTSAINSTISLSQLGAQRIDLTNLTIPDDWTTVSSYSNSWADHSGFVTKYRKTSDGEARMIGGIDSGTINTTAFTLPQEFWPVQDLNIASGGNTVFGSVKIDTSGNVVPNVGNHNFVSLDMSWTPANRNPYLPACFPIKISSRLSGRGLASSIILGSIVDKNKIGGQIVRLSKQCVSWHNEPGLNDNGNVNSIVIDNIDGLIVGHTYTITMWALPEQ